METVIIIPARYESSRFPGKPLALIQGCPMIGRVILRAQKVAGVDQVCVATDDERIRECARPFHVRFFGPNPAIARAPTAWPRRLPNWIWRRIPW